jgi:hypothetical protein
MPKSHAEPKVGITVFGKTEHHYPPYRWREAIMQFLFLVWGDELRSRQGYRWAYIEFRTGDSHARGVFQFNTSLTISFFANSQRFEATSVCRETSNLPIGDARIDVCATNIDATLCALARLARDRQQTALFLWFPQSPYTQTAELVVKGNRLVVARPPVPGV